jgi:hypothetical protein
MLLNPFWFAPTVATDPNFASVVLLCHFEGANGATGVAAFVDSSSHAHTFSAATLSLTTAQQKFGVSSVGATGQSLALSDSADWDLGAGQFTVEVWARPTTAITGIDALVGQYSSGSQNWYLGFNGNNLVFTYSTTGTSNVAVSGAYTVTLNTWTHFAADRDASNVLRVYANGVVIASATVAATFFNSTTFLAIADLSTGTNTFFGQLDDLRITKGVARYAGAFTPPTAAFPNS